MRYSLDTNIVSDLIRNPQGRIAAEIRITVTGVDYGDRCGIPSFDSSCPGGANPTLRGHT